MAKDDDELAKREWFERGLELARQHKVGQWALADWYLAGQQEFGPGWCRSVVDGPGWPGEKYSTLKVWASVARRYPPGYRYLNAAFSIYQEAAVMPTLQERLELLDDAAREGWTVDQTRIEARMRRRAKPAIGADIVHDIDTLIARDALFRAALADPPWMWAHQEGRRGAPTGHYPLMPLDELCALPVPRITTRNSMLFLWCSAATIESHGLPLIRAWDYAYKTHATWDKAWDGVGSYWRMAHECLLLGVRNGTQTHFDDGSMSSIIRQQRARHSEKPSVHSMIQKAIGGPWLELFARRSVEGWTVCGNEIESADDDDDMLDD